MHIFGINEVLTFKYSRLNLVFSFILAGPYLKICILLGYTFLFYSTLFLLAVRMTDKANKEFVRERDFVK